MILINLLPPELRKRSVGGSNSLVAAAALGAIVVLISASFWGWIKFVRLPNAERVYEANVALLALKTAEAQEVLALKTKIKEFEDRRTTIVTLLGRKMYWAHTFDDFANYLNGTWVIPGFQVGAQEISIVETTAPREARAGDKAQEVVIFDFKWKYKLMGIEQEKSGDYMNAFFKTTEKSDFWVANGFLGKPEDSYKGDAPRWNKEVSRVVVDGALEWSRLKVVDTQKKKKPIPAPTPAVAAVAKQEGN